MQRYLRWDAVAAGLSEWERKIVRTHAPVGGRAVVAGCGGGREMLGLASMGYEASGFDVVEHAVERANEHLERRGLAAAAVVSDAGTYPFERVACSVVWFSWFVYSYIFPGSRRLQVLARVRESIGDTGCAVLVVAPVRVVPPGPSIRWARRVARLTLNPEPPEETDFFDSRLAFEHGFTREAMEAEARAAGLSVVEWRDDPARVAVLQRAAR